MDGQVFQAEPIAAGLAPWRQRTLKSAIGCVGVGVHSGRQVRLTLRPAPAGHGIVFRRTDLGRDIAARYDAVIDTRLCTVIANTAMQSARVGTIEHVMAALAGARIDNAVIEVDGPEVPILDGSAAPFSFLLECAGTEEQDAARSVIEVLRPVRVSAGEATAMLEPLGAMARGRIPTLDLHVSIDFSAEAIGQQTCAMRLTPDGFRDSVAPARTFALAQEVDQLRAAGLALGGSLDNALVVDGATVLNPGGLRMDNEFVLHKLLDVVGDLALAGGPLHARFTGHRPSHALNNKLLRALFADSAAWRTVSTQPMAVAA